MTSENQHDGKELSVIICTYNRSHLLEGCIEALGRQLVEANAELVVVDDGSRDETQDVIDRSAVPIVGGGWVDNRGLNAARNEGLRLASAPVVLYFDDDQIPPAGYLKHVVRALGPDLDGIGGPLRDKGGGLAWRQHAWRRSAYGRSLDRGQYGPSSQCVQGRRIVR